MDEYREIKIVAALKKLFKVADADNRFKSIEEWKQAETEGTYSDGTPDKRQFITMDPANVCACYPLSDFGRRLLLPFMDKEYINKLPELDYKETCGNGDGIIKESISKYSMEYILKIMAVFKAGNAETMKIAVKKDFPASFINEDVAFILAPMDDND